MKTCYALMKSAYGLMKTAASPPNEAKSPSYFHFSHFISSLAQRLHSFISPVRGEFVENRTTDIYVRNEKMRVLMKTCYALMKAAFGLMKTAASPPNEAKSPSHSHFSHLISSLAQRLHSFISPVRGECIEIVKKLI